MEIEENGKVDSEKGGTGEKLDKLDKLLEEQGNFGKYQLKNSILIIFPILLTAFYQMGFVFTAADADYRCKVPECEKNPPDFNPPWMENAFPSTDDKFDKCQKFGYISNYTDNPTCSEESFDTSIVLKCKNWVYDVDNSIVSEFDFGCDIWKRTLVGSLNSVGQLICMPLSGFISDKYGRKTVLILGSLMSCIFGCIKALVPNYWSFVGLEFLERATSSGVFATAFILVVELVAPNKRLLGSIFVCSAYSIGEALLGFIAWRFQYWRTLLLVCALPASLVIFYYWFIPESVRWLLNKKKFEEAGKVLKTAAKYNDKELSDKTLEDLFDDYRQTSTEKTQDSSIILILKSKILLIRLICCSTWWITCTFVYYGLSINSVSVNNNIYMNYILVSLVELPAQILYLFTVNVVGRKYTICWAFFMSGLFCISFAFIPEDLNWLKLVIYLLGKFCITVAFTTLYIYTSELFPTPQRNSMMGVCSMFGRFGSIIAPQTPLLSFIMESLPLLLFGAISIISGFTILAFPETNKIKLPDTIEEAENLSKQKQRVQ